MTFIAQAIKRKTYEEGTGYKLGQSLGLQTALGNTKDDNSATSVLRDRYAGVVHTCVSIIAREVAKHPVVVSRTAANGDIIALPDHDLSKLIQRPNKYDSEYDQAEAAASFYEMVGEQFFVFNMFQSSQKPAEAYVLRPDLMTVVPDKVGNVVAYEYNRPDGGIVKFTPEEVAFAKTFNPYTSYRGIGTIQANIRNIAIEDSARS